MAFLPFIFVVLFTGNTMKSIHRPLQKVVKFLPNSCTGKLCKKVDRTATCTLSFNQLCNRDLSLLEGIFTFLTNENNTLLLTLANLNPTVELKKALYFVHLRLQLAPNVVKIYRRKFIAKI
jgi:hypothetical protein